MIRLIVIATFATLACAVWATSVAGSPTSSNSDQKTKKQTASPSGPKGNKTSSTASPLKGKTTKPKPIEPPLADFSKGKRPKGQELAKELKERLKKTGSLSGQHHPAVDSALKKAASQNKRLFVLFMTTRCKICRKMQSEALDAKEFQNRFLKDYVVLAIDCDKKPDVADHYLFTPMIPHYKIIDASGQIVKQKTGYDSDEKFADWLMSK